MSSALMFSFASATSGRLASASLTASCSVRFSTAGRFCDRVGGNDLDVEQVRRRRVLRDHAHQQRLILQLRGLREDQSLLRGRDLRLGAGRFRCGASVPTSTCFLLSS